MNTKKVVSQDLVAGFFLVGMVIWFNHEMVWTGQVPFFRDLGPFFYPMRYSLAQSFTAAEVPLWDRHIAMGFPLLANLQSETFYPPHLIFLLLSFFTAIQALFIFHYLVAATGSYWLCRHWQYPPYLALVGAILFTLGGTVVSLTNLLNHFHAAVWLPAVLLFGERCLGSSSWKNFLLFTSVLLVQFLAGSPEIYGMTLGLLFLDLLRFKAKEINISYRKLFFLLFAANVLVAGLAMAQILPTLELFLESRARQTISYPDSIHWSLRPLSLINLFFLDREPAPSVITGLHLFFAKDAPLMISLYSGAISLLGIFLWLLKSSSKEKTVLLGLVTTALILAVGDYTPVHALLFQYLPFYSLFRFPEKFFFLAFAFLLFMTLRGLFRFLESRENSLRGPFFVLSSVWFLFFLSYLFLRFDTEPLSLFIARATHTPLLSVPTLGKTSAVIVHLERQIALTSGILLLFFLGKKGTLRAPLLQALLVTLVFIDLSSAHRPYQYLLNPELVYKSPKIIAGPDPEPHRFFYYPGRSNLHPSSYAIFNRPSFAEFNSLVFSNLLPNTGVFHGFDYMQELDALGRWPYANFLGFANRLSPERQYRLLGALNVKYVNSFQALSEGGITLVRHFSEYPSWLYRIDRVIPRVYVVPEVLVERDSFKILDRLSGLEFDPLKQVILEQTLSTSEKKSFQAEAKILRYTNNQVTIRASLNGSGVLVLADSFYPGWRAYVDGKENEILRANLFFRGVPLPAGEHLVEFRYQPRSFAFGLVLSLTTLAGLVLWSVYIWTRGK
ncbi:MAG: YfhO family protein [Deltaproteobacteria bacterium]|nr:YfhO family protein [Deltaproteobacteria bacterium]